MFHSSIASQAPAQRVLPALCQLRYDLRRFWLLWLVVGAAIFARIYGIDRFPGIMGDEGWYGVQVQRLLDGGEAAWRTPTGNVPGLIQYGALILLHSLFQPSALLLRLPTLVSSLAAMAFAYLVARKHIGPSAGMAALVLLACLPVNIAYARLGWDPSHTSLLVLLATLAAMERRALLSTLAFALAMANHPSAVFAAPFLAFAFFGRCLDSGQWKLALARASAFAGLLAAASLLSLLTAPHAGRYVDASTSIARLTDWPAYSEFALLFSRLLSGDTIFQFLVGAGYGSALPVIDAFVLIAIAVILTGGLVALYRQPHLPTIGLVVGWLAALALFFTAVGPWGMRPSLERFGVALIPPTILAIAALGDRLVAGFRLEKQLPYAVTTSGAALLAGFFLYYCQPLARGDQRPGAGIRIGIPGLNQSALQEILQRAGPGRATIITEDSWIYWPVTYRAGQGRFLIVNAEDLSTSEISPFPGETWWITYRGSKLDQRLSREADVQRNSEVESSDGRQALNIWFHP